MLDILKQLTIPQWAVIVFLIYMYLTGKLNINSLVSLFKPQTTQSDVNTANSSSENHELLLSMLKVLSDILVQAKQEGDKQTEDAVVAVIPKVCKYDESK
jgi:uncharacterized membrane protein